MLNHGWSSQVGSLEKGKFADIIAVSGNPLQDVREMERVKFVMKGGVVMRNELTTAAPRRE
jgi:imidazolonepropionase-like amidohydrolase